MQNLRQNQFSYFQGAENFHYGWEPVLILRMLISFEVLLKAHSGTLNVCFKIIRYVSMLLSSFYDTLIKFRIRYIAMLRRSLFKKSIYCDFSWEGGCSSQNSYKPSRDLCEVTLLRRARSVQQLARSLGINKQKDILLLYYKDRKLAT